MKFFVVFALAIASAFSQTPTKEASLEERVALAEKREVAAKAALDAAEARCRTEKASSKEGEFRICDPFHERVEWMEASRELLQVKTQKLKQDNEAFWVSYEAKKAESDRKIAKAEASFCEAADKQLADPKTAGEVRKALLNAKAGICDKKK